MISMRGQSADYDHWRQLGLAGWSWNDVSPIFRELESHFLGATEHHGARRRIPCLRAAHSLGHPRRRLRRRQPDGHPEDGRFQHRNQRRRRPLPRQPTPRPARLRRNRLSQAGRAPPQSPPHNERRDRPAHLRRQPRHWCNLPTEWRPTNRDHKRRSHPLRRRHRLTTNPATLRRRPGRHSAISGRRNPSRPPRRRPQSAGPPAATRDLQGLRRPHAEHGLPLPAQARLDGY